MPVGHYPYDAVLTFPNRGWQVVAYFCFLICIVINSGILARRPRQYKLTFTSFKPMKSTWIADVCALLVFLISFCFIVINGMLTFGVGTNMSATCDASVVLCVSVFVVAKVLQYVYYLERLSLFTYVRHNPNSSGCPPFMARFRQKQWLFGAAIFSLGVPCAILLGFSKEYSLLFHSEGGNAVGCHVFLRYALAIPTIVWAGIINSYILICFAIPLVKNQFSNSENSRENCQLRRICKTTIWSTLISGVCTVINLSVLLILNGEHGIECLLCCSIDVMVNSLVLAIITDSRGEAFSFSTMRDEARRELVARRVAGGGKGDIHEDEGTRDDYVSGLPSTRGDSSAHSHANTLQKLRSGVSIDDGAEKSPRLGEA